MRTVFISLLAVSLSACSLYFISGDDDSTHIPPGLDAGSSGSPVDAGSSGSPVDAPSYPDASTIFDAISIDDAAPGCADAAAPTYPDAEICCPP